MDTFTSPTHTTISGLISRALRILDIIAGICFSLALIINVCNVVGRYGFQSPIFWAEEVTVILIIWSVCLMSFKLTLHNEHLLTDILRPYLPERWKTLLTAVVTLWTLALSAFIAYYAFIVVEMVGKMSQVTTVAEIPKSLAYSSILACFILVVLASALSLTSLFSKEANKTIRQNSPQPTSTEQATTPRSL